ncbi:hypothetical protein B0I35DRAFT_474809 [Stachybotrys elegans]|uniref:COP9 signalosome complex subunit 3 N-terminal helical repeats domain-containing protein n=1 Tax=Stachybotrys elegans TaxID=80388 RepID=A0A8K0WVF1_9HYPO|nr:hypothetical protein B0I35DRAFT_474809 [Stachybotrys elegans]
MQQILAVLHSSPQNASSAGSRQYDTALKEHAAKAFKVADARRSTIVAQPMALLESLQPGLHTIGYLAVLDVLFHETEMPAGLDRAALLNKLLEFLMYFDAVHIRYAGRKFQVLVELIAARNFFDPLITVELLANVILRLDPSGSLLTSTHLTMLSLALETQAIEPALKVVEKDICYFPKQGALADQLSSESSDPTSYITISSGLTGPIKPLSVLDYNILCGQLFMRRRDWARARDAFGRVLTHPVKDKGINNHMVDSYRHWILLGLLSLGRTPDISVHLSHGTKTSLATSSGPYINVAALFTTNNATGFKGEIEAQVNVWQTDGTVALIQEVVAAYQKWQIIRLHQIYTQVSLSEVRNMTLSGMTGEGLRDNNEVRTLVEEMIAQKMLKGELQDGEDGESYLTFHDDYELISETEFARKIAEKRHVIEELGKKHLVTDEMLSSNKEYVRFVARENRRAEKEAGEALDFDAQVEDEDLMTGLISNP